MFNARNMISIVRADISDFREIANLGKQSFIESHGHSASDLIIETYVKEKYSFDTIKDELENESNIYHKILYNDHIAGYSKIILNDSHPNIALPFVTKLERLYLLKEFYELKLGFELLKFNFNYSQINNQNGMWLYVWKENDRAVNFYTKNGFKIIGSYDFKISENHFNPNHQMLLVY